MASGLEQRMKQRMLGGTVGQPWTESQEREADGYLAGMAVWNHWLVTVLMLISLLFDTWRHSLSFGSFALLGVQLFSSVYLIVRMRHSTSFDYRGSPDEDLQQTLRKLKKSAVVMGTCWGVMMLLFMQVVLPLVAGDPLRLTPLHVVVWLVAGAVFGVTMYFFMRRRVLKASQSKPDTDQ